MYNFRYHLVTIVSIFAALAIGLLLGVAITGSELVKDTSNDMFDSLMTQFDELNDQNRDLATQLEQEQDLRIQLYGGWQNGRLDGRTIVILTADNETDNALGRSLANTISGSGGIPVVVSINPTDGFGSQDEELATALSEAVAPVEGEDYSLTVARALSDEWSLSYKPVAEASGTTGVEEFFDTRYPLTSRLLELGRIEIKVDYSSVLTALSALIDETTAPLASTNIALAQQAAYQLAQDRQLPYACNGLIDTVTLATDTNQNPEAGQTALQLATFFNHKGLTGGLPYLNLHSGEGASFTRSASQSASGNYYAVLVQRNERADDLLAAAYEYNLSCVFSPLEPTGRYGVIALLSGAESGVYGLGRDGVTTMPLFPTDQTGKLPFTAPPTAALIP